MSADQSNSTVSVPDQDVAVSPREERKSFFEDLARLRTTLLANGYSPIPNRDKATYTRDWPTLVIDTASIDNWSRRKRRETATGLRVENGLCVVDMDVDDQTIASTFEAWLDDWCERKGVDYPLVRRGKGAKGAFFFRVDETFGRVSSLGWVRPGETADDAVHRVEIFGGAQARQFGSFGPHTLAPNGGALISYRWEGPSPLDVPLRELPELRKKDVFEIADKVDEILKAAGWAQFEKSTRGEGSSAPAYDIDPAMAFHVMGAGEMSLAGLKRHAADNEGTRCSASFLEGAAARNESRCLVHLARSGSLAVWDSATGITHYERSHAPVDHTVDIAKLGAQLKLLEDRQKYKLVKGESVASCTAKLLGSYAYCGSRADAVVPILEPSLPPMTMTGFRGMTMPWSVLEQGPRGGEKRVNPADLWHCSPDRRTVEGVQMRPGMPFPVFVEDGNEYVNTYEPPIHGDTGGDATIGVEFMEQLLPDAEERGWFLQWLAYKYRHPDIPGPAVLMVARDFGTGRGTLQTLLTHVFGSRYVKGIPFATFTGQNSQAQYNEWSADNVIVCVNESSEVGDAKPWQRKSDVYEHLKEIVDPRPMVRLVNRKGEPNFFSKSSASYLIATNNPDALPLPDSDRRFAVLTNGKPRDVAYWDAVNAWMSDAANIGAFVRFLLSIDLATYSPFAAPLKTRAKRAMSDMAVNDIERGVDIAMQNLHSSAFVVEQLVELVRQARDAEGLDLPERWEVIVKKILPRRAYRIGEYQGRNWRLAIGGKRYAPYATSDETAARWTAGEADDLKDAVLRNGYLDGAKVSPAAFVR